MDTFHWKVRPGMRSEQKPRTRVIQFGDGYEQRCADGLNVLLRRYTVMLSGPHAAMQSVDDFLVRHRGVTAFLWQPPGQAAVSAYVCRNWSTVRLARRTEISGEFEQVVA
ncbi:MULTISPECIES: phage tail protein [Pantoea]|uniref:phage tail protein n=1 Tax=Pantoea TaxID=53335 RepID=UPI001B30EA81|nr:MULTISPECIES: phage tail protein [Pantoea]